MTSTSHGSVTAQLAANDDGDASTPCGRIVTLTVVNLLQGNLRVGG